MKILMIATKAPWPLVDGSRVLVHATLEGLAARGHEVTLVAPHHPGGCPPRDIERALAGSTRLRLLPVASPSYVRSWCAGLVSRRAVSIERHCHPVVRAEVARLLAEEAFDLVHVEQIQAWAQAEPAEALGLPVLLRAQNVESDLWAATARARPWLAPVLRREAALLATCEAAVVRRAGATVALTGRDGERLSALAGGPPVEVVRAPYAPVLPAGERVLPGSPALVLVGSEGWLPNQDAVRCFTRVVWPAVRRNLPAARLHVFGNRGHGRQAAGLDWHPAPADSRDAFAPGAVLVVPLRIASGVRIRILEAWARGTPVIAFPEAVAGLDVEDGRELLVAGDERGFVAALRRLMEDPGLAARLTAAGRAAIVRSHDPERIAAELEAVYFRLAPPARLEGAA